MKTIITVIILLIIGVGAYYFINSDRFSKNYSNENAEIQNQQEVDEACENALIRMTFTDGEAAAKFVSECKEGKHPEVVEQFRLELN